MNTLHHAGPRTIAPAAAAASPTTGTSASPRGTRDSGNAQAKPAGESRQLLDPRDQAAMALYEERGKLLAGLMAPAAESWENLPEDLKERWRRTSESADGHR